MIEMSVDKETVLSSEGKTDPPSHQHPELSGNDSIVLHSPIKTADTHLCKEDRKETGSETSHEHKERTAGSKVENESSLLETNLSTQAQNDTQQFKTQPQRINKRRNTMSVGFKYPGFGKRRRRANSESSSVLPTNFLLGGNIFDPLNLNSLLDEEVNRALNAETPKSSPLPAKNRDPVEILIPRDITDPLNLNCPSAGDRSFMVSPLKSGGGGRRRHRNKHHGAGARGLGEAAITQTELTESNGSSAVQADRAASVPMSCLESGTEVDSHLPEVLKDDQMPLSSTLESLGLNQPDSNNSGNDEKEKRPSVPPGIDTNLSSKRPRRRKRAGSRMENSDGGSHVARNCGETSERYSQPFHTTGTGCGGSGRSQQHPSHCKSQCNDKQHQQQQKKKFQYGNYNKYYGYRNPGLTEDPRIRVLKPEWFRGKAVLDLGCNTGHLTLSIAKNWRPARIVGLDIDRELIHAARQNIRHYLSEVHVQQARRSGENGERDVEDVKERKEEDIEGKERAGEKIAVDEINTCMAEVPKEKEGRWKNKANDPENKSTDDNQEREGWKMEDRACLGLPDGKNSFPVSLRISRGPIAAPPLPDMSTNNLPPGDFPANITFVKGNYVLESDLLLQTQKEEYDVILCLSVTKWVHLNWGDAGLKRLFHRVYRHLRPGGLFILEPQPWNSYGRRKKLTEVIFKNYHSIRFKPDQFSCYLTTDVGFSSYELIGNSQSLSRGFQRPIYIFHKGPSRQK
ncbi:7SK snRNA methylphosphate capping enzyme [Paramisgurnus dabryanus]|uniref:7SK snRNA methylphosphate capping enzyme n=1 Tax=Paramisgurnus dabryanus TaxID=90735 RepID=UPI0031F36C46